jgi:hypothetical protein
MVWRFLHGASGVDDIGVDATAAAAARLTIWIERTVTRDGRVDANDLKEADSEPLAIFVLRVATRKASPNPWRMSRLPS